MWDERYSTDAYVYGTEPNGFLVSQRARLPAGRALCLAEGEGRNAVYLAEQGWAVTAVDLSGVGLAKAERLARERGVTVETVRADLAVYDLGEAAWDLIVAIWCHVPSSVRHLLHQRVTAALKPGGCYLLEAYSPRQLQYRTGGPSDPDLLVEPAALRAELPGLKVEKLEEIERTVHEGKGHTGLSAVTQALFCRSANDFACGARY